MSGYGQAQRAGRRARPAKGGGHQRTGGQRQGHEFLGARGGREHLRERGRAVGEGGQGELEEIEVPGRASLGEGARGPDRKGVGRGGDAAARGGGGDQPLVGGESARAEVVGHEGGLESLCRYVLHDEVAVGSDQGRVVVAGVGVGPTEAHEHA